MELLCTSRESLIDVARQLLDYLNKEVRVVLFEGDLGAGKTSLIQEVCTSLGCTENVTSPTFSLINEYLTGDETIYHIDLYRLESTEEALQIGIEDYLYSGNWCFIEWPDLIKPLIDLPYARVNIEIESSTSRIFSILKYNIESTGHE
ncbi:MAG: tRNA (adenosine(37)-N6)-threonylcarbamoyltransferase complex ATPase subunit type 1 TsaE [Bacteroidetes bacterium]|nr:MAG: tRNA (adenosine(37)-N6)-threonylcarbamoyltransferase complex ATPase subunit type 1 TsaE [Bacteroidota bacterium]